MLNARRPADGRPRSWSGPPSPPAPATRTPRGPTVRRLFPAVDVASRHRRVVVGTGAQASSQRRPLSETEMSGPRASGASAGREVGEPAVGRGCDARVQRSPDPRGNLQGDRPRRRGRDPPPDDRAVEVSRGWPSAPSGPHTSGTGGTRRMRCEPRQPRGSDRSYVSTPVENCAGIAGRKLRDQRRFAVAITSSPRSLRR